MIMFVFLLILLMNIIFALPMTTIVPSDMIDNTLKSSDHLHESVNALQSAIEILFPKKDQHEKEFAIDRQSLLIGCLIKKIEATEEQRRACKGLHENNDKNVYYEFEDKSLGQKSTEKDIDHSPINVEHINVARIENNKEKSINDTVEEIQKLNAIKNRLINHETDREKMNLDSIYGLSSSQKFINQSTLLDRSLNKMDVDISKNNNHGGLFLPLLNNDTIEKTTYILSNIETVKQIPQYYSSYSIDEQKDDDQDFKTNEIFSRFQENNDDNYDQWDINVDNETEMTFMTNNNNEKLEQENKSLNESARGIWSISRYSNDPIPKNVLLTDLTKALETLETIVDGKGLDSDGDQISFKPADLRSILKSQKFSGKFLQFLNTIKSTVEQLNANNKTNSIN